MVSEASGALVSLHDIIPQDCESRSIFLFLLLTEGINVHSVLKKQKRDCVILNKTLDSLV